MDAESTFGLSFVPGVAWPLVLVWVLVVAVLALGVQRGIGNANKIFVPLLVVLFGALVIQALLLDGSALGLDAFFTPNWEALTDTVYGSRPTRRSSSHCRSPSASCSPTRRT